MIRAVDIRNRSGFPIEIGTGDRRRTVPPFGTITITYAEYLKTALDTELSKLDLKVSVPSIDVKRVSVKDFGAIGDGITDDTIAVQAAIDYVAEYGGGVVDVPIGIYVVNGLLVTGNVFLQGESKNDSVLKLKSGSKNALLSFSDTESGISKVRMVGNGI